MVYSLLRTRFIYTRTGKKLKSLGRVEQSSTFAHAHNYFSRAHADKYKFRMSHFASTDDYNI